MHSALALVHQRFSTNTFPSWPLAHPYRFMAHNGEINTLRGNINWMRAREGLLQSPELGRGSREDSSDHPRGRLRHGDLRQRARVPGDDGPLAAARRAHDDPRALERRPVARCRSGGRSTSTTRRSWRRGTAPRRSPSPTARVIGAVLDRNGLRPSRYCLTTDDLVIMASEVGVLDIPPENIVLKGRLHPGKIFLVDTALGRIVADDEIKRELAAARPYGAWLAEHLIDIADLPDAPYLPEPDHATVLRRQQAFGYTQEDLRLILDADGAQRRGTHRVDGHRHVAGRALEPAARALRLFQAAVRAGDEPAARRHPRRAGDVDGVDHRPGRQPAGPTARVVPADQNQVPGHQQRGDGQAAAPGARGVQDHHVADAVRSGRGRAGARAGDGRSVHARQRCGERRLHDPDPVRSRREPDARAHPEPARHGGRAPSPGARRHAHALCAGDRVGRRARGAPLRAAPRLRRGRRQSVPRVRVAGRPDPPGTARGRRSRDGGAPLHQGAQQGHPQGDVQDGDLDAAELLRRTDLRGARPVAPVRRQVLHVDPVAHWRRRHRGSGRGGGAAAREGVPAPDVGRGRSRLGRRVPVAPGRRVPPVQSRDGVQAAARHPVRAVRDLQGVHAAGRRPGLAARDAPRIDPLQGLAPAGADRRGRARRDNPEAVLHWSDVVRIDQPGGARDAGDRDEPDRREVEHRRGRRGSRPLHARRERRLAPERHQAGRLGPLRRHERVPRECGRPADQDGAGRQTRRGRTAAGAQGVPVDRQGAVRHARASG